MKVQQKDERAMVIVEPEDNHPAVGGETSHEVGVIRPVASAEEVLAAWQQFQDVKRSLLTLEDYQEIQGRARIKKSGWRKIAAAFGISDQILWEERREHGTAGPARLLLRLGDSLSRGGAERPLRRRRRLLRLQRAALRPRRPRRARRRPHAQ